MLNRRERLAVVRRSGKETAAIIRPFIMFDCQVVKHFTRIGIEGAIVYSYFGAVFFFMFDGRKAWPSPSSSSSWCFDCGERRHVSSWKLEA